MAFCCLLFSKYIASYRTRVWSLAMLVTHSLTHWLTDSLPFSKLESDHRLPLSLTDSLTHSLTDSCLVNLIEVTLVCEYAYSKLVEFVTAADEYRVGNSLLQIWKLRFGHKAKLLFRLWAQGLVRILKLKFRRNFEAEVWSVFCCFCCSVEVTKLKTWSRLWS